MSRSSEARRTQPVMAASELLKSCAMPPVNRPSASVFWLCISCTCSASWRSCASRWAWASRCTRSSSRLMPSPSALSSSFPGTCRRSVAVGPRSVMPCTSRCRPCRRRSSRRSSSTTSSRLASRPARADRAMPVRLKDCAAWSSWRSRLSTISATGRPCWSCSTACRSSCSSSTGARCVSSPPWPGSSNDRRTGIISSSLKRCSSTSSKWRSIRMAPWATSSGLPGSRIADAVTRSRRPSCTR
ncbi:hypothetical protein FQZ97_843910 [compost metagenome]